MITVIRSLMLLLVCCLSVARAADTGWLTSPDNPQAQVRLRAEHPAGDKVRLLLDVELADGWKTYWRSPGEGGVAPEITWDDGVQARWFWPRPQRFDVSGLTAQGYQHRVSFPLEIPRGGLSRLRGVLTLSVCSNICVLADYPLTVDLSQATPTGFASDFAQALRQIPQQSGPISVSEAHLGQGTLSLQAESPTGWGEPALFLDTLSGANLGKPTLTVEGNTLSATLPVTDEWGESVKGLTGKTLSLVLANGDASQYLTTPIRVENDVPVALWVILLTAVAGGLILNLMPCVLPVLGMKLSSVMLVPRQEQRLIRWRFLATTGGILTSFLLLALLMSGLRLSGAATGWGIQFQNPWFIGMMVLVTLLFSLNLAGVFALRLPAALNTRMATAGGYGLGGSFLEGMFATLLATPCSAPFLGTAVAFALAAPLHQLWSVFLALGVGMSLPWLLIAALPGLTRFLPKPGHWMQWLRMLLALMMLGSSLWLLSLFTAFFDARYVVLAGGILLALVLYIVTRTFTRWAENIRTLAFMLLFGSAFYAFLAPAPQGHHTSPIPWQPLTEATLNQSLREGKRVFVDVTADWCINCKINELLVLHRPEVVAALAQGDVVALQGNWTKPSEEIRQFLRRYGGIGVPFNAIYGPTQPQGVVLSPLLNKQHLLDTLASAKGETP